MGADEQPSLGQIIGRVLRRVPVPEQPLLIAIAERMAADRYRAWADEPTLAEHRATLLACAAREEDIAARVEGLYPGAAELQRAILERHPDLVETNRRLFAGEPLRRQLAIQAEGERLGAATWRAFAAAHPDPAAAAVLAACAPLEEESAVVLEAILGAA
jgi:hypothetical protein